MGKQLWIGNPELSPNQPAVQSTIHMSLWFAFRTLRFTLFQPEVLVLLPKTKQAAAAALAMSESGRESTRRRSDGQQGKGDPNVACGRLWPAQQWYTGGAQ